MKLFLIIYLAGKISMIMGPLADTREECQDKAELLITALIDDDLIDEGMAIAISCEFSYITPEIEIK